MKKNLFSLINNIKMGNRNKKLSIIAPNTPSCMKIINILQEEGYIDIYQVLSEKTVRIFLKYLNNKSIIQHIKGISRPSLSISYKYSELFNENQEGLIQNLRFTIKKKITKLNIKKIIPNINMNALSHISFIKEIINNYRLKNNNSQDFIIKLSGSKKKSKLINLKKIKLIKLKKKNIKNKNIKIKYNKFSANKFKSLRQIEFTREARKINFAHNSLKKFSHINNIDGLLILSTTQGIMTHKEAYNKKLGGVCLCEIY
jgi:ribosomal protein S8